MIISVQYYRPKAGTYTGQKYSYFCNAAVRPGNFVKVLVGKNSERKVARVAEINVPESEVDARILPVLKTVVGVVDELCEDCAKFSRIGGGDHVCTKDPYRMPVWGYRPTEDYFWCEGKCFAGREQA